MAHKSGTIGRRSERANKAPPAAIARSQYPEQRGDEIPRADNGINGCRDKEEKLGRPIKRSTVALVTKFRPVRTARLNVLRISIPMGGGRLRGCNVHPVYLGC